MAKLKNPGFEKIYQLYEQAVQFNQQIGLYDEVENNENFYVGKQWEGVKANGNPTPVFNVLRRVTTFQVAKINSDNFAMVVSAMGSTPKYSLGDIERICDVVNKQLAALVERNKIVSKTRELTRNAAVDRDGCMYSYWDSGIETGQMSKGDIVTEIVENTRVHFGNPQVREVQVQPWIIISTRMQLPDAKREAKANGYNQEDIVPDRDQATNNQYEQLSDNKVTVLIYMAKDPETGHIWSCKCTQNSMVSKWKDTGLKKYPVVWMCWDYVQNCYHGHALISQLIPNQVSINKTFALAIRSLSTTAFSKYIYDKTRIPHWDSGVGKAIAVNGGDINSVARVLDPAPISPQVAQFLQLMIESTQSLMGASDAALGDTRPDNTSAIIALQRASDAPLEAQKRGVFQAMEDLAYIYVDMIRAYYGTRYAQVKMLSKDQLNNQPLGMTLPEKDFNVPFDFDVLNEIPLSLKVDVGASSYWSEIASVQTLDNLIRQNIITLDEYLERMPDGYIAKKQELIDKRRGITAQNMMGGSGMTPTSPGGDMVDLNQPIPVRGGGGYNALARSLNETGTA